MISPCVKICKVQKDICIGCGRTDTEIERWQTYTNPEKKDIKAKALVRLQDD